MSALARPLGLGQADQELAALGVAAQEIQPAAMAAHQFGGDGKAQAGAALARAALEGGEQVFARLGRQARAGVADADPPIGLVLAGRDLDGAGQARRLDGLAGVADQVR